MKGYILSLALLWGAASVGACSSTNDTAADAGDGSTPSSADASLPLGDAGDDAGLPAPRFTKWVIEPFGSEVVAVCEQDDFDPADNPGYATGPSGQIKNVTNRLEWVRPLMSDALFKRMELGTDPNDGGAYVLQAPHRKYPMLAYDRRAERPDASLDEQLPVYLPKDSDQDRITDEMRKTNPGLYPDWATFKEQVPPADVVLVTTCSEAPLVQAAGGTP